MSIKMSEKRMKKLIRKLSLDNRDLENQIEKADKVNLYERMTLRKELTRLRSILAHLRVSAENVTRPETEDVVNVQHTDSSFWEKFNKIESGIDSINPTLIQYETSGLDASLMEKAISCQPIQKCGPLLTIDDSKDNPEVSSGDDANTIVEDAAQNDVETDVGVRENEGAVYRREDDTKEPKCRECGNDISWESFVAMHRAAHKAGVKIPPCFTCNMSFLRTGHFDGKHRLKRQPKRASGVKRCVCETCGSQFTSRGCLLQHYATHRPAQYTCDFCGYKCRRKTYLKKHIETHNRPVATENESKADIPHYADPKQSQFKCYLCSHVANTRTALNLHQKSHTNNAISPANRANGIRSANDKKCNICAYSCSSSSRLKSHLKSHYGIKPFPCEFCEYKATTKYNLSIHRKLHLDDKQFRCDVCKYSCVTAAKLNNHMKRHR